MSDASKDYKTPNWLNTYYESVGAFTITVAIILFLIYGFQAFCDSHKQNQSQEMYEYIVTNAPSTSQFPNLLANKKTADSLITSLYVDNCNLKDSLKKIKARIKKIDFENVYTENRIKIFASIISIIIAVVGFFGFKSISDIRDHSIKVAKFDADKIARDVAKNTAKDTLTKDYVSNMFNEAYTAAASVYEGQTKNIIDRLSQLDKRILRLENIQASENDSKKAESEENRDANGRVDEEIKDTLGEKEKDDNDEDSLPEPTSD